MALSFLYLAFTKILQLVRLGQRDGDDLAVEIVMLRHELAVLRRHVVRPDLEPQDRALFAGLNRLLDRSRRGRFIVQPETLLRWHRDLVGRKWTHPHRPGRPSIPAGTVAIILRLARENPTWGYRRIQGELATAGVVLAPSSVWAILKRLYVLFFIELDTRRVHVTGIAALPTGSRVVHQARNLTMVLEDRVKPFKFLIRDRDTKCTSSFDGVFMAEGIRMIRTPATAARANAFAERFVGTSRRECLDRMLIFGRIHLERVLAEYVAPYNDHRPHRALGQLAPLNVEPPPPIGDPEPTRLRRKNVVFGLIGEDRLVS